MTLARLKYLALVLGALLIMSFLYTKTQAVATDIHTQLLDHSSQFKRVDAILNQHIMEIRQGLLPFYDPTVGNMSELGQLQAEMVMLLRHLCPDNSALITQRVEAISRVLAQKEELLEGFKTSNAVLHNSLRYLPLATARFPPGGQGDVLRQSLNVLLRDILIYNLTSEAELGAALGTSVRKLRRDSARYPARVQDDLAILLSHVGIVLEHKTQTDTRVQQLLTLPTAQRMGELQTAYITEHNRMMQSVNAYRQALYGFSLLLLGYIAYILFKLRRTTTNLQRTITDLNYQKFAMDQHAIVSISDRDGTITYANQKFCDISQFKMAELIGQNHRLSKSVYHPASFYKNLWDTITQGKVWHGQVQNQAKDGSHYWVDTTIVPFVDDKKVPYQYVAIRTDITEIKQTEAALRRAQKMEAIGQLSGGIAHDFNNQLGVIIGYLDFLKDQFPEDQNSQNQKPRQWVDTATRATLRCMDLTRKLLVFSRRQAINKVIANLNALLKELGTVITRSVTPEVEVQTFLSDSLWLTEIDPGEFQDAILNLVINARDAMPSGGKLLIETSNIHLDASYAALNPELEPGDYIQLMLSDTGTGMDKETLEHVFEPFFTTKPEGKGTGLGLAMVYGFVKRYGGYIKVYSEPDMGTTIRLYLPRSTASKSAGTVENAHEAELPSGNEAILIVDDEADLLQLADQYLSDLGYRTQLAENAAQALKILAIEGPFDLIFSDVVMPGGMNGYELAQQATEQSPGMKVLLTSGFTSKIMANNGLARFSAHLLGKPYRKVDLAQRIRRVLDEELERVRNPMDAHSLKGNLAGRAILVVDDEEDIRELFKLNLSKLGCKTIAASNGDEAITLYRQSLESGKAIDVIILDLTLPGSMGGKEIADKIRALDPHAKMIVSSGHTESPEMTHYQDYGFQGALEKNFNRESTKHVLEQVLASSTDSEQ